MATFTCFVGALRPSNPGNIDEFTFYYPILAEVLMLDADDVVQIPGDDPNMGLGLLELASTEPMEATDTLSDWRRKLMGNLRPQYPQIDVSDEIIVKYMDDASA
jgi:hypothetical protein